MLKVLQKTDDNHVPTLREVSPEYARLCDRQGELNNRIAAATQEMRAIWRDAGDRAPPTPRVDRPTALRIAKLLDGDAAKDAVSDVAATEQERFIALSLEIADIKEAMPALEGRIRAAHAAASAIIREGIRDRHSKLVAETAATLRDLHRLNGEYWELTDQLNRDNVAWASIGSAFMRFPGHPKDRGSQLGYWFRDAAKDGHIASGDVPEVFK